MSTNDLLRTTRPTMGSWDSSAQNLSKINVVSSISSKDLASMQKDAKSSLKIGLKNVAPWTANISLEYHLRLVYKEAQNASTTELSKAMWEYMMGMTSPNGSHISKWKKNSETKLSLNDVELLSVVQTRIRPSETTKERDLIQCSNIVRTRESDIRQSLLVIEETKETLLSYNPVEDDVANLETEKKKGEGEQKRLETKLFLSIPDKLKALNKQKVCIHLSKTNTQRSGFLRMKNLLISERIDELIEEKTDISNQLNQYGHYINELNKKIIEGMTFDELEKKTMEEMKANQDAIREAKERGERLSEEIVNEKMYKVLNDTPENTSNDDSKWNDIISKVLNSETQEEYKINAMLMLENAKERELGDDQTYLQRLMAGTETCLVNNLFTIPKNASITLEVLKGLKDNTNYINKIVQFLVKLIGETYLTFIGLDLKTEEIKDVLDTGYFGLINYIKQMATQSKSTFEHYQIGYNMMSYTLNKDLILKIMNEKATDFLSPKVVDKKHRSNLRKIKESVQGRSGDSESSQTKQEIAALTKDYKEDAIRLIVSTLLKHPTNGAEVKKRLLEEHEKLKNGESFINSIQAKPSVSFEFSIALLDTTITTTTEVDMKTWIRASKHFPPVSFLKTPINITNELNVFENSKNKGETKKNEIIKTKVTDNALKKQLNVTQSQINSELNDLDEALNKKTISMPGGIKAVKLDDVEKQILSFTRKVTSALDTKNKNGKGKRQGNTDQQTKLNYTCFEFNKTGKCRNADRCRFKHSGPGKKVFKKSKPGTAIRSKTPCPNLKKFGMCHYGDNCIYSH